MGNDKNSGWKDVFLFTIMQQIKSKAFKIATIIVGAIILIGVLLILLLNGIKYEEDKVLVNIENISEVYILDETKDFSQVNTFIDSFGELGEVHPDFNNINFTQIEEDTTLADAMEEVSREEGGLLVNVSRDEDGIILKALLAEETNISFEESELVLEELIPIFEMYKIGQSELSGEQLAVIIKPIFTTIVEIGETESSEGEQIIKLLVPMLFSFAIYLLLIVYAQSIMNSLMIEKTSKLTEMLLTAVQPQKIITGKILALSLVAILQFLSWLICGIIGFIIGNIYLNTRYPDYINPVIEAMEFVQNNTSPAAFSALAIILSILALCLGFLFYFSYAGIIGASLSKAEDISSGTGIFYIPVIACGLITMLAPMIVDGFWRNFINYFPFTAPFILPANILNGNVTIIQAIISIAILIISSIICFMIAGKLYKGLIFFKGEKIKFNNIVQVIRGID